MNIKLKNNSFEAIQVTGEISQFGELKHFCGDSIHIEYATCEIDDYWKITLDDDLKGMETIVPKDYYIIKVGEYNGFTLYTTVSNLDFEKYFVIIE